MAHVFLRVSLSSERRKVTKLLTGCHPIHQMPKLGQPSNIGSALPLVALQKLGSEAPFDGFSACPSLKLLLVTLVANFEFCQRRQNALMLEQQIGWIPWAPHRQGQRLSRDRGTRH